MIRSFPQDRLAGPENPLTGLTRAEAEARRARYGENRIVESVRAGWFAVARDTLRDPMLWFLFGAGVLFGFVGEITESVILLLALIPFVGMDAFLHRRAQASIEGLSSRLATVARVIRDRRAQNIAATEVVPGDVVEVKSGEVFPADGVIIAADQLQVDESTLTGESLPVRKDVWAAPPRGKSDIALDGVLWGFAGTRVLAGRARMIVGYTGGETLYGEIVRSAVSGTHERTPLQRAIANLVKILIFAAAVACIALAWVRIRQGHGLIDALLSALTLAVAALPEEFPVVLTFFLGVGVYRLAQRQALVRRSVVVENIGRVSFICSDKTGTITEGRLTLTHRFTASGLDDRRLLVTAAAASRAETDDPVDTAILAAIDDEASAIERLKCFPFTEDRKRETAVFREGGQLQFAVKGAPELILDLCDLAADDVDRWSTQTASLAASGHKVIACAWRVLDTDHWYGGEPEHGFRFAGLLAFEDPVRAGVAESLQTCRRANIHVLMVTGDHPETATAVAREIGLGAGEPRVIDALEMERRIAAEGGAFLRGIDVIARAVPAQKLGLVRALQANGEIVAVTGDGVNDVPALQAADIGIAMGERGTRSAREVAAIVLLDDNLRSIVRAIAEGRQLFTNLQLSFQYLLMIHIPLVITAAVIPLTGDPLLYLPVHIVWLEMIIHPSALLVFQNLPPADGLIPRRREDGVGFFDARQWWSIIVAGASITVVVTVAYEHGLAGGGDVEHARALALAALTVASAGITAVLSRLRSVASRLVVGSTMLSSVAFVQVAPLASLLHLRPLHADDWLVAGGGALAAALLPLLIGWRRR